MDEPSPEGEPEATTTTAIVPASAAPLASASASASANAKAKANADAGREGPSLLQRLRAAPITAAITAINFAVFVWAEQHGGTTQVGTLLEFGAVEPHHVWAGEYWRLATYMFLHIGWIHILVNTYASFGWATTLETVLGKWRFVLVYLLAGVAGGAASVVSGLLFTAHTSAGASGALFGIVGATLALRLRRLESVSAFLADKGVRSTLLQLGLWFVIGFQIGFDNAAHVGGFAVGGAMAWLFTTRRARVGWVAFAVALVALLGVAAQPWPPRDKDVSMVIEFAQAYLDGSTPDESGRLRPWPHDEARGVRFLDALCNARVAVGCHELAEHWSKLGAPDAASKSDALRKRACEIDPASCAQIH